jgi:hypothetical protein
MSVKPHDHHNCCFEVPYHKITLAVLNIVPSEPEKGGSIPCTTINSAYLLGIMPIADLIC